MHTLLAFAMGLALIPVSAAAADPCRAIKDEGWLPAGVSYGATFSGPVVHVIDGDSFCVAIGQGEKAWVEVRLADFFAQEMSLGGGTAKSALERLARDDDAETRAFAAEALARLDGGQ